MISQKSKKNFFKESKIIFRYEPTIPSYPFGPSITLKKSANCEEVEIEQNFVDAHNLSSSKSVEGMCPAMKLGEGDGSADSHCVITGKIIKLKSGGFILINGGAYCEMAESVDVKHEYSKKKTIGRYVVVRPVDSDLVKEGEDDVFRNQYKIDIIEGENGELLTQIHVFNGTVLVTLKSEEGEATMQFEMEKNEQIHANDQGELVMQFSFDTNQYEINDLKNEHETSSCNTYPGVSPSIPDLANVLLIGAIGCMVIRGRVRRGVYDTCSSLVDIGSAAYTEVKNGMAQARKSMRELIRQN